MKENKRFLPILLAGLFAILSVCKPTAMAAPSSAKAAIPEVNSRADASQITVTAVPNLVMNGNAVSLYGRCVNLPMQPVTEAGFYVSSEGYDEQRIVCNQSASQLSGEMAVSFDAEIDVPYDHGYFRAFVLSGGNEVTSGKLPFQARPPLPSPVIRLQNGAKLTPREITISWESVEGAACYGISLRDITAGDNGPMLLGQDSADTAAALYWVDGGTTSVKPDNAKLKAGHTYRLFVYSAYDKQHVYGHSVDFQVISDAVAKSTAPSAATGLYCLNEGGTVTLYGTVDSKGRPLDHYGFLAGKDKNALRRIQVQDPEAYAGGLYSADIDAKNSGTLYYRAYAKGENGIERMGELKTINLEEADPFTPETKTAEIADSYVPLLSAIDPGWAFGFIKTQPYNYTNTEIQLLEGWEEQHILKGFDFPVKALNINAGAKAHYAAAAAYLNETLVKVIYKDGSNSSFLLKDIIKTAASYNARYIYPTTTDSHGNRLSPDKWSWRLSLHSWGASVDINAAVRVNRQIGINFQAIRSGAVKINREPGIDSDGAIVLTYDGYAQQGCLLPDDVSNYILYELAFKKAGFYWGAYFGNNRTDPMHFSLIEIPAKKDIPLQEAKELAHE